MLCATCGKKAVFSSPALCAEHFIESIERRVAQTIEKNALCTTADRILVAASGGKDSLTVLAILAKLGYTVEALAIDEGIVGYREHTLIDLRLFCDTRNIPLKIVSFADTVGKTLDAMVEGRHPCSVCGVFRRHLLLANAKGYDVIATGHNLDDEAQSVLMNLAKANIALLKRTALRTPETGAGIVPRIKPLAFISERETTAYAFLSGFQVRFVECPYAYRSLRGSIRDALNAYEETNPCIKQELLDAGLAQGGVASTGRKCEQCNEPSAHTICKACVLTAEIRGDPA